jgi:hypothetical protein
VDVSHIEWLENVENRRIAMIGKLIGKLVVWGLLLVVIAVIALGGYFFYKAGQPMQVVAAQRLAPGITYREYWADRIQRWGEIDDQKEAQGKGRACIITGRVTFIYWIWGSIVNVTRVHNQPGTPRAKAIIAGVNGIIPPDELVYGPWWKLPDAWWWEIENMSWYFSYRPLARAWNCEVGAPRRPTDTK